MIPCCAVWLLPAAMQAQSVRFTDLRYFVSQFHYAFSDGILHDDRLAPQTRWADRQNQKDLFDDCHAYVGYCDA